MDQIHIKHLRWSILQKQLLDEVRLKQLSWMKPFAKIVNSNILEGAFAKIGEIRVKHLRWKFVQKGITDGICVKHLIGAFCESGSVKLFREKFYLRCLTGSECPFVCHLIFCLFLLVKMYFYSYVFINKY